jgi:hypothetical protein
MSDDPIKSIFKTQAQICAAFGSTFYAGLMGRAADDLDVEIRALFAPWDGLPLEAVVAAAVALRFLGALNDLALSGEDLALTAAFPPVSDPEAARAAARAAIRRDPARFHAFMAHEPQTNEVRRSACLLPGFLTIAAETGLPLACFELGASAGLNQLWRRFRYNFGAAGVWGDPASPVRLTADWTGPPPPLAAKLSLASVAACDRKPIDIADPVQRRRLEAYIWPDQAERIERFEAAVAMALASAMKVDKADALDWTRAHCAPQNGLATVIYHSIFWQYLPEEAQASLRAAIETHGAAATPEAPLAWLRMEPPDGSPMPIELWLTLWPGGQARKLATVHAHGASVDWAG